MDIEELRALPSVPKCEDYRKATGAAVCVSLYCEQCQAMREKVGIPLLTHDTVTYSDTDWNIVRGTD